MEPEQQQVAALRHPHQHRRGDWLHLRPGLASWYIVGGIIEDQTIVT